MRSESAVEASFAWAEPLTRLARRHEHGSLRLRLPNADGVCEAVLINTGGGVAGGDRLSVGLTLGPQAHVVATSQSAERIYRAEDEAANIAVRLSLGDSARLDWLPQETILFDGARLRRTLDVDMAASATLTLAESIVFGRVARGETVATGSFHDRWRIRRSGRLVLAEDARLHGDIDATLARPAVGAGARAIATIIHVAPDAERRLALMRRALRGATCECGASAWNGVLIVRLLAGDPAAVRAATIRVARALTRRPLPRSWSC